MLQKGYIVVRALGRGAFGEVFLVKRTEGRGWVAAVKKIKCRRTVDADRAYEEVRTLQNASHRSVLQLRSSFVDHRNNVVYLVTEYCEQGSLNESLQNGLIPWSVRMEWFEQLLQGLVYLHDRVRVAHRDLKPDNILVTKSNDIKIADFGLAKKLEMISFGTQYHPPTEIENAQQEMTAYMLSHCGTKSFMAPEVFRNHYTKKADIFSLALIFILIAERAGKLESLALNRRFSRNRSWKNSSRTRTVDCTSVRTRWDLLRRFWCGGGRLLQPCCMPPSTGCLCIL